MSLESVKAFFREKAPDIAVIETPESSATVELAALAHGVAPARIAKTICLRAGETALLVVTAGDARLDNAKFRARFGAKARMLGPAEVLDLTGHPVGGVCPFGLATKLPVFCDESLRRFDVVVPAAGATNAAVRITPQRMADLTEAAWSDVCRVTATT